MRYICGMRLSPGRLRAVLDVGRPGLAKAPDITVILCGDNFLQNFRAPFRSIAWRCHVRGIARDRLV